MTDTRSPRQGRVRSYTVAVLLGVFIVAVVLAVLSHFLPGRLSTMLRRAMDRRGGASS